MRRYPAHHRVMVNDKLRILAAMKELLNVRLTTVFPRHALDQDNLSTYPPADLAVERIGDLLGRKCSSLPEPSALVVLEKESK